MKIRIIYAQVMLFAGMLLSFSSAHGATIRVPGDYATIQEAITTAAADDTVLVSRGTYYGPITIKAGVTLASEFGPEVTVIDGQGGNLIRAQFADHAHGAKVKGFTLRNGTNGIYAEYLSGIEISGNIIKENSIYGICLENLSNALILNNTIADNGKTGIRGYSVSGKIANNIIRNNSIGGIWLDGYGSTTAPEVVNNVIHDNLAGDLPEGGGLYVCNVDPEIRNNIIINNSGKNAGGIRGWASRMILEYNDVWNNTGTHGPDTPNYYGCPSPVSSISQDPVFSNLVSGDYRLMITSPCVNSGNPQAAYNDPDGTRNDMGCYGGPNALENSGPIDLFVRRDGTSLVLGGKPYYFNAGNNDHLYHWSQAMVTNVLDSARSLGLNALRIWASSEGLDALKETVEEELNPDPDDNDDTDDVDYYCFQKYAGQYHEPTFANLDYIIAEAGNRGIRLIMPLVDNWHDGYGGMPQYTCWSVTGKTELKMSVYNPGSSCSFAVAMRTGDSWTFFEAEPQTILNGWNELVWYPRQPVWKCEASGWKYTAPVTNLHDVRQVCVILYSYNGVGSIYLDNMRLGPAGNTVLWDKAEELDNEPSTGWGTWKVGDFWQDKSTGLGVSADFTIEGDHSIKLECAPFSQGEKASWKKDTRMPNHDIFFTDNDCRALFKAFIDHMLDRTNTITGIKYKNDPAILMWELANEPRCESDTTGDTMRAWIDEMAAYIKERDPNHLVATGAEGYYNKNKNDWRHDGRLGTDFIRDNQSANIDICSFHMYPEGYDLWTDEGADLCPDWILEHVNDARTVIGKPVYLGEYGITANRGAPDAAAQMARRNWHYRYWFDIMDAENMNGAAFWQLFAKKASGELYPDYWNWGVYYPEDAATSDLMINYSESMKYKSDNLEGPALGARLDNDPIDDLIVGFGLEYGLWIYSNNSSWALLHPISPKALSAGNIDGDANGLDDLVIDFGQKYGIWIYYNNSGWAQLHNVTADSITAADLDGNGKDDIVIDFGYQYGVWIYYNNSTWSLLHGISPKSIVKARLDSGSKDDLVVDFGSQYGIWIYYNNSTWSQLHPVSPETVNAADMDNNGQEDLIIDFGSQYGVWVYYNNSTWVLLNSTSPESIITADLDQDPKDDIIVDFGAQYGIWIYYNNSAWSWLHNVSPDSMTKGDLNGNGKDELIIDFGPEYGIWVRNDDGAWWQLHTVSP